MAGGSKQRRQSSNNHRRRETSDRKQKKEGKRPRRLRKLVTNLGRWLTVTVKRRHGEIELSSGVAKVAAAAVGLRRSDGLRYGSGKAVRRHGRYL